MTDEEKEAIEIVKGITEDDLLNYWEGPEEPYNAIQTALNLIEKQQKEIEILNKNMNLLREQNISYKQSIHGLKEMNKKWEDKIKARIKELEEYLYKGNIKDDFLMIRIKAKIQELQSLLEKEKK